MNARKLFTLFSNLDFVIIGDVRCHCHVAMLSERLFVGEKSRGHELIGIIYDMSLPSFELSVPSGEYELTPNRAEHTFAADASAVASSSGVVTEPLATGAALRFHSSDDLERLPPIQLIAHDSRLPVYIEDIEFNPDFSRSVLTARIAERIRQFSVPEYVPVVSWRKRDAKQAPP